jgi:hypothetical protein
MALFYPVFNALQKALSRSGSSEPCRGDHRFGSLLQALKIPFQERIKYSLDFFFDSFFCVKTKERI